MAALAVIALVAGCGSTDGRQQGDAATTVQLTQPTGRRIANAELAITHYCAVNGDYGAAVDEMFAAVDQLIALYRAHPRLSYNDGAKARTIRQVLSDSAGELEGCDAKDEARQLDRALQAGA